MHTEEISIPKNITALQLFLYIYKTEGFFAFYKGLGASFLGLSHIAIQFPLYEHIKTNIKLNNIINKLSYSYFDINTNNNNISTTTTNINTNKNNISTTTTNTNISNNTNDNQVIEQEHVYDIILASVTSKFIASLFTYPHEILRSRLQDNRHIITTNTTTNTNIIQQQSKQLQLIPLLKDIINKEGFFSLWRGFDINLIRIIPASISTFVIYEYTIRYFKNNYL